MSASSRLPFTSRERRHGPRRSQREVTLLPSTSPRMQTGAFICNRAVREAALAGHGSINARHSCWRTSSHQHSSQASIQLADLMKGHRKTIFIILTPTTHPDPASALSCNSGGGGTPDGAVSSSVFAAASLTVCASWRRRTPGGF